MAHETDTTEASLLVEQLGRQARDALRVLASAPRDVKDRALIAAAEALRSREATILEANGRDLDTLDPAVNDAFRDRLRLDPGRIEAMAAGLEAIAALPDPVGRELGTVLRPNGLRIERVAVPIGVIAMIYESRPNVGADSGALCLKSGNAVILRGGSESRYSSREIAACLRFGLAAAGLPENAVQQVDTGGREAVGALLRAVGLVDLVIPRGGRGLVELVRDNAKVPVLLHLDGNCHTYVHEAADIAKAVAVIRNAKLRRTGVCGATESIVIDRAIAARLLPLLADAMPECELRGDARACALEPRLHRANPEDFDTEYLDAIASVAIVDGLEEAIAFVSAHGSGHTDAILTEDSAAADRFMAEIDSAIVMHNASTQFADGGEFGMGAEIGIATGRLHARGPVGLEQLTTYKYLVHGTGQTRA